MNVISRVFSATVTIVFLTILSPLVLFVSILVLLLDSRPVIFSQKRVGKNGKIFTLYKFRTMKPGSESLKKKLLRQNEASGPVFKIRNDPRFTAVGRFLSHTGLDELPQIFNVLRGDMGFIGPRPLPVDEASQLQPWQLKRHAVKPGIISLWVLNGYHKNTFDSWMKSDIEYAQNKNVWLDTKLFLKACTYFPKLLVRELVSRGTS